MKYIVLSALRVRYSDRRLIVHYFDSKELLLKKMPYVKYWEWDEKTWKDQDQVSIFSKKATSISQEKRER
jgi:hypothetical protein